MLKLFTRKKEKGMSTGGLVQKSFSNLFNRPQEKVDVATAPVHTQDQMKNAQQNLVNRAITDPKEIIEPPQVAYTTVTPDQLIDTQVGNAGPAPQAQTSVVSQADTMSTPDRTEAGQYEATQIKDEVSQVTEGMEAATADPSTMTTVRGQLESLMSEFEGGETPPWASGAMRKAMGVMQSRGMGASSVAGAAVVQAAMESAIGIASQDAATTAQFEMQNLNNQQQTTVFKTQQRLSGLLSDQAAVNASSQFNATSENQTNQFFSNLEASASQFNTSQINAIRQFNAGQENAIEQFNKSLIDSRNKFNAQNSLVIAQANAQWRQNIATAETAAQNVANLEYTRNANAITGAALDQLWQRERDLMDYAFTSSESSLDRSNAIILQKLGAEDTAEAMELQRKANRDASFGAFLAQTATGLLGI